ncbi:hypothetical protein JHV56_04890 [Arthrobacter sp. BHU FT2]|nr:hypothetical protein [Arthrobacter sp. BHU FT2]
MAPPRAGARDTAAFMLDVFLPTAAKGAIIRRPGVEELAERLGLDRRAVRRMQDLDRKYPDGPLLHRFADTFLPTVHQETEAMLRKAADRGVLDWDNFNCYWQRIVRRVVFGDAARDDTELTDLLARLRKDANWSGLKPRRRQARADFLEGVQARIDAAEPGRPASHTPGRSNWPARKWPVTPPAAGSCPSCVPPSWNRSASGPLRP